MDSRKPALGVVEETAARTAADDAELKWSRSDDAWDAIKFVLAHDPEPIDSVELPGGNSRLYLFHGARSVGLPDVAVVYFHDENNITIVDALFSDAKAGYAGNAE